MTNISRERFKGNVKKRFDINVQLEIDGVIQSADDRNDVRARRSGDGKHELTGLREAKA